MDAVAIMAPGRFRRRLSDDHSDTAESPPASSCGTATVTEASSSARSWLGGLDGTASTRGRLPWLSPRERRHPLRDVRLSCFRSYLPGSIGGASDGDLLGGDSTPTSPRTPKTPRLPASSKDRGDKEEKQSRGLSLSVRRSPGRSRGSKSSENVYFVSPPRTQGAQAESAQQQPDQQQQYQQQPQPAKHGVTNGANLSARLRALSARCMALVHAAGGDRKANAAGKKSSRPCKQRSFSSGALPGLHDFQRRQLNPIYRDDGDDGDDAHPDDETPLSPSPSNGVLVGDEDCDSGILVSEAASTPLSSLPGSGGGVGAGRGGRGSLPWGSAMGALGAATAASRALRSASLDRELLGGSPLLDHDEADDPDPEELSHVATSQARRSRASTKSSSSSSEISEIFSRFQRRRVAGTSTPSSSSRPSSPPLLPAPPQRSAAAASEGGVGGGAAPGRRREFHLVRLTRAAPTEELGIFIAKSDAPDRGAQGYVVAHVVPGGLAHRDGQLRLGDELVVVNGRQLRGLSMAAARQRLRAGPTQVDIVIARQCQCHGGHSSEGRDSGLDTSGSGDSMTECCCRPAPAATAATASAGPDHTPSPARRTLPESSVDYENVVLRPRDRTPVLASSQETPEAEQASDAQVTPAPSAASSTTSTRTSSSSSSSSPGAAGAAASLGSSPSTSGGPSPRPSPSPSPMASRQQLFLKHATPASTKAARRSLAVVPRSGSPPLEPLEAPRPAETQHHSLKRRARRHHGTRPGGHGDGVVCSAAPSAEFRVELRKGPGCGALGFTVVGGADSPRGALPIFVRSVLEGGQAANDGRLQPGDELFLLNGQPLRGATHSEAVAMFRAVRAGPVVLTVCRRTTKKAQSCSDLVVGQASSQQDDA